MNCQWCSHNKQAVHWGKPVVGPESAMCDGCLRRVGKKDEQGNYIAMPIAEMEKTA